MGDVALYDELVHIAQQPGGHHAARVLTLLQSTSTNIRKLAATTLGHVGVVNEAILDALRTTVQSDSSPHVREQAAKAIGVLAPSVSPFVSFLSEVAERSEEMPFVRKACESAIQHIVVRWSGPETQGETRGVRKGKRFKFDQGALQQQNLSYHRTTCISANIGHVCSPSGRERMPPTIMESNQTDAHLRCFFE